MNRGNFQITLKIEFSIPKLLFGNNFDEIEETDFPKVISTLIDKLENMGIRITEQSLINAKISAVHYSKNIPLTDYSIPSSYIKEISKLNLNKKLDLNQTDYRNAGHCLKFHSNSYEVVFYDKMKDLEKAKISEKRAIENDNYSQFKLFPDKRPKKPLEVLRIEIRLNNRSKLKQIFKNIEIKNDLVFSSVVKKDLSQKILLNFINKIESDYSLLAYRPKNEKDFLLDLKINNPNIKLNKLLQMYGFKMAIDKMGIREFRDIINSYGNNAWYRIKRNYSILNIPFPENNKIDIIKNAILNFEPLKLSDFFDDNY